MVFLDRADAGKKLAEKLVEFTNQDVLVVALPRGGVPVGFEIAKKLNAPLDVLVVRKLGAPAQPEFGIGAIAPGVKILDEASIKSLNLKEREIAEVELKEQEELNRRTKEYRGTNPQPKLKDRIVILVDDGLATGVSARVALKAVLAKKPKKLIIAIPVCAQDSLEGIRSQIRPIKDEIICLTAPDELGAISNWYKNFNPVSDSEVTALLKQAGSQ